MHAPADRVARGFNLKSLSDPLPQDPAALAQLRTSIKGRPVWVAASTHRGEEEIVLQAHQALRRAHPELLLILAPRHPDRGADVEKLIIEAGFDTAVRSRSEKPTSHAVYLADTLGELGSWYALTKTVFLGGSLLPIGGHNPFEVAQSDAITLSGPHVTNFAETYEEMTQVGAARIVEDATALTSALDDLLIDAEARDAGCRAARAHVRGKASQMDKIAERLIKGLRLEEHRR